MLKTKGHFTETQGLICIAVKGCPFESQSKNMTPFLPFYQSVFTVCPLEDWEVVEVFGQQENVAVPLLQNGVPRPQPHLLSTAAELFVCSDGVGESEPGLPTASPPGGITTMTHSFIWRVCVCVDVDR